MQAKLYLSQAYRIDQLIQSNEQELADLKELSVSISGIDTSKDVVQTSPSGDATYTRIIERIDELERVIKNDIERLLKQKLEIKKVIDSVPDNTEKLLLHLRYLQFMTWCEVCETMHVSTRTVRRIHAKALDKVDEILKVGTICPCLAL